MPRVVAVKALEPFKVWIQFRDGCEGVVDLDRLFSRGGVFTPLRDPTEFAKVRVEREFGTIEWPGGVDLDPEALYAEVSGLPVAEVLKLS